MPLGRQLKLHFESRKFLVAILIILIATVSLFTGFLTGREWVESTGATMLFYGATNVGEHFATKPAKGDAL